MLNQQMRVYQIQIIVYKIKVMIRNILRNRFKYIIAPLIISVATSGLIFQHFYLLPAFKPSTFYLLAMSSVLLYAMCFWSFYQAIVTSNLIPPGVPAPRHRLFYIRNHPFYTQKNQCFKDNGKFKPIRVSHCSVDGCMARMDHHCPYIDNCVGLQNFKSFILFTLYGGVFAAQFLVTSIHKYYSIVNVQKNDFSESAVTVWMILTVISFLLALSMIGLGVSNLIMAAKNLTRMDLLKGSFRFIDKDGTSPNPFDLGVITNLSTLFQQSWLALFPTALLSYNDGTSYPMVPPIQMADTLSLPQNVRMQLIEPIERGIPKTIEQLKEKEKGRYQNVIFFFLGERYDLFPQNHQAQSIKSNISEVSKQKIEEKTEEIIPTIKIEQKIEQNQVPQIQIEVEPIKEQQAPQQKLMEVSPQKQQQLKEQLQNKE